MRDRKRGTRLFVREKLEFRSIEEQQYAASIAPESMKRGMPVCQALGTTRGWACYQLCKAVLFYQNFPSGSSSIPARPRVPESNTGFWGFWRPRLERKLRGGVWAGPWQLKSRISAICVVGTLVLLSSCRNERAVKATFG